MADNNQSQRDIAAHNVIVTLNGKDLPRPLSVQLGNESVYKDFDGMGLGSFVDYRPTVVRMTFPITKIDLLRKIGTSEEEMKKDYQMAVRFMAADRAKPLTVSNLQNVRFTSVQQIYPAGGEQPFEEVIATVLKVTHEN